MKNNKEINLGKGIGTIGFGATMEQVKAMFGEPDEVEDGLEEEEMATELWHFDDAEISFGFDEDERVITLSVTANDYMLGGKALIGLSQDALVKALQELKITDIDEEVCESDGEDTHTVISSDLMGVHFWLENGTLIEIQWEVLYDEDGDILWA
jgi:hypothetical protein